MSTIFLLPRKEDELLTHKIKSGDGRVSLGVGVGLVKEACIYLLTDASDHV